MNQPTPPEAADDQDNRDVEGGDALPQEDEPDNEEQPQQEPAPVSPGTPETSKPDRPVRSGRPLAFFALLIALAAAGGSGYLAWINKISAGRSDAIRADLSGEIGRIENSYRTLEQAVRGLERIDGTIEARLGELASIERNIGSRLDGLEAGIRDLASRERTAGPSGDWQRAEAEYLMRIANQQLSLARNPEAAMVALEEADSLLARMADPRLQTVRQQLSDDILALSSVRQPDVEGLALRLGSLSRKVESLPLAGQREDARESRPDDGAQSGWARLRSKLAEFFGGIFRVRRTEGSAAPLLSPEEAFFLRRNLELELQAARIAVLTEDAPVYRASLGAARRWTEEYFRRDDGGVSGFIDALRELEGREITVDLPDISGSLRALAETRSAEGT
jgi:uroporphyrin-3 C-methyltransferase